MRLLRPRPKASEDGIGSEACNVDADCESRNGPVEEEPDAKVDDEPEVMASYRLAAFFGDVIATSIYHLCG